MSDNNMKFNLFIGENFNELISLPTNKLIIRNLLSVTDRDVVVLNNSLSLPELVQKLMDKILYGRKEIVEIISNIFSMENKSDLTFYNNIFDSNIFSSIISTNYDYTLEENFLNLIKISTPFNVSNDESGRVAFYKVYGDYKDRDKFIISTQDVKRVKMLAFYNEFWEKLRTEFNRRPTILFTVNLEDMTTVEVIRGESPLAFSPNAMFNNIFTFRYKGLQAALISRFVGEQYLTNTGLREMMTKDEHGNTTYDTMMLKEQ